MVEQAAELTGVPNQRAVFQGICAEKLNQLYL